MAKILVAYSTNSGSTEEVAQAVGEELGKGGAPVDVRRLEDVTGLEGYSAVVVGAPMILGWHRPAMGFLKKHRQALAGLRVAYFATAMSLTTPEDGRPAAAQLFLDPGLAHPPQKAGHPSLKERYALASSYLKAMLGAAPQVKPLSVAFFGGKLELFRLKWWQALFVMAIIGAQPADLRDWTVIRQWAAGLRAQLE